MMATTADEDVDLAAEEGFQLCITFSSAFRVHYFVLILRRNCCIFARLHMLLFHVIYVIRCILIHLF